MTENAPGGVLNLFIRTADHTRKNAVEVDPQNKCGEIIEAAVQNWSLPVDTDYSLIHERTNTQLDPQRTLAQAGIQDGDTLEIQPVLVAG